VPCITAFTAPNIPCQELLTDTLTDTFFAFLVSAGTNRCEYYASAISATAKIAGLDGAEVAAALQGKSGDVREAAALRFATALVEKRGRIDDAELKAVTDAGFTPGEVSEIVAHVVVNIFTNYFNNVARTQIDSPWANQTKAA
jgi:alkylhydroperoxidase family enzyme